MFMKSIQMKQYVQDDSQQNFENIFVDPFNDLGEVFRQHFDNQ